jgi:hypothetical protein
MSDLMSDEAADHNMGLAKMLLQELCNANWTEDETFFAISFAYVFMCKASGESDDKLTERISKIAAAMTVEPPTEQ